MDPALVLPSFEARVAERMQTFIDLFESDPSISKEQYLKNIDDMKLGDGQPSSTLEEALRKAIINQLEAEITDDTSAAGKQIVEGQKLPDVVLIRMQSRIDAILKQVHEVRKAQEALIDNSGDNVSMSMMKDLYVENRSLRKKLAEENRAGLVGKFSEEIQAFKAKIMELEAEIKAKEHAYQLATQNYSLALQNHEEELRKQAHGNALGISQALEEIKGVKAAVATFTSCMGTTSKDFGHDHAAQDPNLMQQASNGTAANVTKEENDKLKAEVLELETAMKESKDDVNNLKEKLKEVSKSYNKSWDARERTWMDQMSHKNTKVEELEHKAAELESAVQKGKDELAAIIEQFNKSWANQDQHPPDDSKDKEIDDLKHKLVELGTAFKRATAFVVSEHERFKQGWECREQMFEQVSTGKDQKIMELQNKLQQMAKTSETARDIAPVLTGSVSQQSTTTTTTPQPDGNPTSNVKAHLSTTVEGENKENAAPPKSIVSYAAPRPEVRKKVDTGSRPMQRPMPRAKPRPKPHTTSHRSDSWAKSEGARNGNFRTLGMRDEVHSDKLAVQATMFVNGNASPAVKASSAQETSPVPVWDNPRRAGW